MVAAVLLVWTGLDLLTFILPSFSRMGMSGTWDSAKLGWMGALSVAASFFCGWNAWRIFRSSPQQRIAGGWSSVSVVLWWMIGLLGLLVYYPLPYFNHHTDKFFLFLLTILAWAGWFRLHPSSLERVQNSQVVQWARLIASNGVLFLILAELAMRLADPLLAQGGLFSAARETPGGGIPFQTTDPSGMRTNSRGFRDRERTFTRTSSSLRIVAVGDSFTWGSGSNYDETFLTRLERRLQESDGGAEVVNLGLVGYQPEEYLALLRSHGLEYRPDLVLVDFYVGNDLMPAQSAQMIVAGLRHHVHVNGNWFHDHLSWDHWYLSHDVAYGWLLASGKVRRAMGWPDLGMWNAGKAEPIMSTPSTAFFGWSPKYIRMILGMSDQYLKADTASFLGRWHATTEILEQIGTLLHDRRIPWILALLPAEEQVDRDLQRLYLDMFGGKPEDFDFDKPQRLLGEWGKSRGIKVIDLTPAFREKASQQRLYVDNDIHWNANGNALAAQIILGELRPELSRIASNLQPRGDH